MHIGPKKSYNNSLIYLFTFLNFIVHISFSLHINGSQSSQFFFNWMPNWQPPNAKIVQNPLQFSKPKHENFFPISIP